MFDFTPSSQKPPTTKFSAIKNSLRRLISLYVENAKLTAVEKLTLLLSTAVVFFLAALLLTFAFACGALALLDLLELAMSPIAAAAILGGIFLALAAILILLRKPLVINPIARFVCKLIMDIGKDPLKEESNE